MGKLPPETWCKLIVYTTKLVQTQKALGSSLLSTVVDRPRDKPSPDLDSSIWESPKPFHSQNPDSVIPYLSHQQARVASVVVSYKVATPASPAPLTQLSQSQQKVSEHFCLATKMASVSLDPPLVGVCVCGGYSEEFTSHRVDWPKQPSS